MLVRVADGAAAVEDADDLTRLSVAVPSQTTSDEVAAALGRLGRPDGSDFVWLSVGGLRQAAGHDDTWGERYEAMIAYAADHGWVSADGEEVRAHVTRE